MAEDRAVISASLDGARQVVTEAHKISGAMKAAEKDAQATAKAITKGGGGAAAETDSLSAKLKGLGANLGGLGKVAGAAGVAGFVAMTAKAVHQYLGSAGDSAKAFGEGTAAASRRAGVDLSTLRATVAKNEVATLQSADAQNDFVKQLAKTAYNGKGAMESLRAVGFAATATSRSLSEMIPVTAALQDMGIKGSVGDELGRITDLAQRLKTIGGPVALQETLAALRPALQQVAFEGARARGEMLGFVATLSQTRRPEQAQAVAAGAIGFVKGNAVQIEYSLRQAGLLKKGQHVLNAQGNVADEIGTLEKLQQLADRKYGKATTQAKYNAVIGQYGPDLGAAMLDRDLIPNARDQGKLSLGSQGAILSLNPNGDGEYEIKSTAQSDYERQVEALKQTREGKRALREAEAQRRKEEIGAPIQALRDFSGEVASEAAGQMYRNARGAVEFMTPGDVSVAAPGGGVVKLDQASAKAIGEATADALRNQPPQVSIPRDPNLPRGNR